MGAVAYGIPRNSCIAPVARPLTGPKSVATTGDLGAASRTSEPPADTDNATAAAILCWTHLDRILSSRRRYMRACRTSIPGRIASQGLRVPMLLAHDLT